MDTTTNLGLKKPELSERYSLAVWNDNSDTIDAYAGTVNTALAGKATTADITAAIAALDVSSKGGTGKYISAIEETDGKINATPTSLASAPESGGTAAISSGAVYTALAEKATAADITAAIAALDVSSKGGTGKYISAIKQEDGKIDATVATLATTVSSTNANAVQSKAVYSAIESKIEISDVFGLATLIEDNTDLDNLPIGNYYREKSTNSSIGHIPIDGFAFKLTVEYINSTSRIRQVFIPLISTAEFYIRIKNGSGWQPWRKFIDASDKFAAIQADLPANNLFFTIGKLKGYNTAGTWTGDVYERYGVTFEPQADGSVYVHGTTTADAWFKLQDYGENTTDYHGYRLTGCPEGGGTTTNYCLQFATAGNVREYDIGSGLTIETHDPGNVWIVVRNGKTVDFAFYPMLARPEHGQMAYAQGAPTNRQLYEMLLANSGNRSAALLTAQPGGGEETR